MPQILQTRRIGVTLVVISAVVFSFAGIFTKGVETESWGVIFWRGLSSAIFTLGYLMIRGHIRSEWRACGWPAFWVTVFASIGTAAFIPAFKLSTVANVALIYAASPFLAAALAWGFISERPSRRVVIAAALALGGVGLIVANSLGSVQMLGDGLALVMTLMMSGVMVIYRRYPETPAALPAALSSLLLLPCAIYIGDPMAAPTHEYPVLIAFGLIFAIASVTLAEGARRLPASETALLSTLEVPLAPLLALLILSEVPPNQVVFGGGVIFAAVIWSQSQS